MNLRLMTPILSAAILACERQPLAPNAAMGLALSMSATSQSIQGGQLDTLTILLSNASDSAVTLSFGSGCQVLPYIADAHGATVLPAGGGWFCTANITRLTLAPNERRASTLLWTGSTEFASEMPLRPLPAGRYSIWVTLTAQQVQLQSTPLSVWVR